MTIVIIRLWLGCPAKRAGARRGSHFTAPAGRDTNVHGIAYAMKRSGLTREQIYYVEQRGYLGVVARQGQARRYTDAQVETLERIASCRRMGLRLDEAGPIANAELTGNAADVERLKALAIAKIRQIDDEVTALVYILTVIHELTSASLAPRAA